MGVLWLRAKAQLRGRALANLFLVLLVGLAGSRRPPQAWPSSSATTSTVDRALPSPVVRLS